ncbi:PREDICTED: protein lethal(2)essential for life-like [Vollenhovia emeryi]|uniref:protein lethal(2)essential for life-like n=1 Tax=Vollenhovia emeryi TaxID=411798 RepID=UPI0005F4F1A1|nr:PREDICTED: protein lethal(2)essential for life-like [Vollenhovia emeryi]
MYLLPLLLSNIHMGPNGPFDTLNPTLGGKNLIRPQELAANMRNPYYPVTFDHGVLDFYNNRPWFPWFDWPLKPLNNMHNVKVTTDDDTFKMTMNVQQYKPEEVNVTVEGRWLVIKGQHKAEEGNSVVSRQFQQRYLLPDRADVAPDGQLNFTISNDGVLTITIPLKPEEKKEPEQPDVSPDSEKKDGASETNGEKAEDDEAVREEVTTTPTQEDRPKPEK